MLPLTEVTVGQTVEFVGFDSALEPRFREQLLAYGLSPRQRITVLQQAPMTIVVCDHVELALERPVARSLEVRPAS